MPPGLRPLLLLLLAGPAGAVVPGGGLPDSDCRLVFGGVDATAAASGVVCTDGDPACDVDGVADGACRFRPQTCTGGPAPGCEPAALATIALAGLPLVPPPLPASDGTCGPPADVAVPVGGAAGATALARGGAELREVDYLNLCCRAAPADLDASRCALAVDLSVAGCSALPAGAVRAFARARALVATAAAEPARARRLLGYAARKLRRVRRLGRRLAARDACGFALALVASHALEVVAAERP